MSMYEYPIKLEANADLVAVTNEEDPAKSHWEPVTAVYRQGDKVVVETDRQMIRLDPGVKVLFKRKLSAGPKLAEESVGE